MGESERERREKRERERVRAYSCIKSKNGCVVSVDVAVRRVRRPSLIVLTWGRQCTGGDYEDGTVQSGVEAFAAELCVT